jgi:hypothetical protein
VADPEGRLAAVPLLGEVLFLFLTLSENVVGGEGEREVGVGGGGVIRCITCAALGCLTMPRPLLSLTFAALAAIEPLTPLWPLKEYAG